LDWINSGGKEEGFPSRHSLRLLLLLRFPSFLGGQGRLGKCEGEEFLGPLFGRTFHFSQGKDWIPIKGRGASRRNRF